MRMQNAGALSLTVYPKAETLDGLHVCALTLPGLYETVSDSEAVRAERSLRGRSRGHCLLCGGPETRDWVAV